MYRDRLEKDEESKTNSYDAIPDPITDWIECFGQ